MADRYWQSVPPGEATREVAHSMNTADDPLWHNLPLDSLTRFQQEVTNALTDQTNVSEQALHNADWQWLLDYFRHQILEEDEGALYGSP